MAHPARSMGALLFGMCLLILGNGLFGTLSALRMSIEGFDGLTVGIVVSFHFVGFALGCLVCDRIIASVGHIRVLAAFAAALAICTLAFPMLLHPIAWCALRFGFGFASAAIFMVAESWLAGAVREQGKASVLSVYMTLNKTSFGIGQFLLLLGDPASDRLFTVVAMLYAAALIPIALKSAGAPGGIGSERLGPRNLWRLSPVGVVGAATAGLVNASLLGLGPVYGLGIGYSVFQISTFMAALLLGSLLLQIPVGRLSDRHDRRRVLCGVGATTALLAIAVAELGAGNYWLSLALVLILGGLNATIYPIAMTHANDHARPGQTVSVMAGLLLAFAGGAGVGPVVAALAMEVLGPRGLFLFAAIATLNLVGFILYRMRRRAPVDEEAQGSFMPMPPGLQSTPGLSNVAHEAQEAQEAQEAESGTDAAAGPAPRA